MSSTSASSRLIDHHYDVEAYIDGSGRDRKTNAASAIQINDRTRYHCCSETEYCQHNPNDYDIVYLDECHSLKESHEAFLLLGFSSINTISFNPSSL